VIKRLEWPAINWCNEAVARDEGSKKNKNSNQAKHTPTESAKTPHKEHEKKLIRQ